VSPRTQLLCSRVVVDSSISLLAAVDMAEEVSREDMKKLKRQAAIRAKEEEFERKRKEEEESKKRQLEELRREHELKEQRKVEERLLYLEKQAKARADKKLRTEKLNQKREDNIAKKLEAWRQREDRKTKEMMAEYDAEQEMMRMRLDEARERKRQKEQAVRDLKNEKIAKHEELEVYRAEAQANREAQRDLKAIYKVDQLKTEATEELESFILNPYPVPLKQILAGRIRPVPTVTQLLSAYKDQKEELKELEDQDIPTRAMLRHQSLFQYVRDIQAKAEAERIHPPQPQQADLGRSRNRGASNRNKSPSSPKKR